MGRLRPAHIDDAASVGRRIHAARARRGLSLRDVAFPGCSPSFLSRVESGERVPSRAALEQLAVLLEVSADELAGVPAGGRIPGWRIDAAEAAARTGARGAAAGLRRLLAEAQRLDDAHAASRALEGLGHLALASHSDSAAALFERARAAEPTIDARERPRLFQALSRAHAEGGRSERSLELIDEAFRDVSSNPVDVPLVIRFGSDLARLHVEAGRADQAAVVLAQVRLVERTMSDPLELGRSDLALARSFAGRPRLAERYVQRLLGRLELVAEAEALDALGSLEAEPAGSSDADVA